MSLRGGDLTTQQRVVNWLSAGPQLPSVVIGQLIPSMTGLIYGKLNRSRVYSQTFSRTFDGVGNMQLVLPDYPVTKILSVTQGQRVIPASVLGSPSQSSGFGYRCPLWDGQLPGQNATLEFAGGYFWQGPQNVNVTYEAGYLISQEPATVPSVPTYTVTVEQAQGVWSRDNGVTYADGRPMVPVAALTAAGQYIPPPDTTPGLYTFDVADAGVDVLISYSFIPAPLEEACIQMIAERYSYRSRVGEVMKSLGGQETVRFWRGDSRWPWSKISSLPPEVMDLIFDYVNVVYPLVGAPL